MVTTTCTEKDRNKDDVRHNTELTAIESSHEETNNRLIWVSDQIRHKPFCTITETDYSLENFEHK